MIPYDRNLIDTTQPFLFPAGSALFANRFLTFESNAAFHYLSRLKQELSSAHVKSDVWTGPNFGSLNILRPQKDIEHSIETESN